MLTLLVLGVTELVVNKFTASSMTEARNLKEFLEETGDYRWVEIYHVRNAEGPVSNLAKVTLVAP